MKKIKKGKNTRPVKCAICEKKMYYRVDKNWKSEYCILVGTDEYSIIGKLTYKTLYVHTKCFNNIFNKKYFKKSFYSLAINKKKKFNI